MEPRHNCKSDNQPEKICEVMALDEKIKILYNLRDGMSNFPMTLYNITYSKINFITIYLLYDS